MTLSFDTFVGIHVACGVGIFIIVGLILCFCTKYAHGIYCFVLARILGIELEYPNDKNRDVYLLIKIGDVKLESKYRSCRAHCLWFIATTTLTLVLMVLFEGCILGSAGVYVGDECPSHPMTCFAKNAARVDVGVFECVPGRKAQFPERGESAWCYGWIIKRQSVNSVMTQIGICGGILGVIGTLFAFVFRSIGGKTRQKVIIIVLFIISALFIPTMILVTIFLRITFSVLAYLVATELLILFMTAYVFKVALDKNRQTASTFTPTENELDDRPHTPLPNIPVFSIFRDLNE